MHSDRNREHIDIKTIVRPNAKRVGILADTHIPDRSHTMHPKIIESFTKVDLILHAGDISTPEVLEKLGTLSETIAVRGNNRNDRILFNPPLQKKIIVQVAGGYCLGLCHGLENIYQRITDNIIGRMGFASRCSKRIIARIRTFSNEVDAIVYGHSHWPMVYFDDSLLFINPGKAFGQKSSSCAILEIQAIQVRVKIIPLTPFKNNRSQNSEWKVFPIHKQV